LGGQVTVYTDGGSRGNPGPGAAAYVLQNASGAPVKAKGFFLGQTTNNAAEYAGFIKGLQAALDSGADSVIVFSDSELLVRQINGEYKVKNPALRKLHKESCELLNNFSKWQVRHIRREENKQADKLVNRAINLQRDVQAQWAVGRQTGPVDNITCACATTSPRVSRRKAGRRAGAGNGTGKRLRLGVLISGGGTTMMNIYNEIKAGRLGAEIAVVISSRSTAARVEKAKSAGLEVRIIRKRDYPDIEELSKRIEEELVAANVDLVIQAGWLCLWKIPARYTNRVMNIHPGLLPSFGGQGMWGHHVHEAVLKAGCKVSGCTVHFCTNEYDKGPIIVQRCCQVKDADAPDTLAERVFEQECIAYPEAIRLFGQCRIVVEKGIVRLKIKKQPQISPR